MLVSEFQDILKHVNSKFIKRIDILNNYVNLYNDDTKKGVQVNICNSRDVFRENIFEAVRKINEKVILGKDTKEFLNIFSNHWNEYRTTYIIKQVDLDWFIEIRDLDSDFLMGSYILTPTEASNIKNHIECLEKPTLHQLLESIN